MRVSTTYNSSALIESKLNSTATADSDDISTLISLLYYIAYVYDDNFEELANTVNNNADILDGVRIVFLIVGIILIIAVLVLYCCLCVIDNRISKLQKRGVGEETPLIRV